MEKEYKKSADFLNELYYAKLKYDLEYRRIENKYFGDPFFPGRCYNGNMGFVFEDLKNSRENDLNTILKHRNEYSRKTISNTDRA
jgi:hypothetical protein